MPSERPTSVLPYLENSEKEATPTSSPLKERNETKHQKQKEDSGNLTVLDITFGDFNAPITSTPKPRIPHLLRDSVDSQREEIENFPAVSVDEMDDSSLKPSIADRWSFAGWAGHDPRPDVQSLTVCIPMEGPAGAFPGAIDLSVQTRSGKELLDRPVPAPAVLRSTEGKPQPKSTEMSTTPPSSRETPTDRSFQQTPQDHRNLISSVHQRPDPDRAKPQPKLTETSASSPSPRKTPTGRSFQQTPQDRREPISSVHQRPDPDRAEPQPKLTETSASSPSPRKTPTGRSFQQTPQDHRDPISSVHQRPDCAHVLTDRTNSNTASSPASAPAVLRSTEGKPQPESTETSTTPPSSRETPTVRSFQQTPQDHRNPISSVHQRPDPDRAKPQPKLTETSASPPSPRKTPTGRSFQQTPQDHRNPISSVHQRPDPNRAKPQPKLTETSASSPSPRKTPTGRSFQQTPQDRREPISSVHQHPDPDRAKPQPKSTETSTSPSSPRETPASRSHQVTLPYLEVNDSPCDGGDQSMDESDAGSGEDYSSGSGEEWEPNSEDEDDPADKLNDTSFLNDCTIREYFEPFKNFMPDDEEPAKHKNGSQKYTRKGVRAARERGTGYVRRNGTVVPGRKLKAPCSCSRSCGEKFTEEVRTEMFVNLLQMKRTSQHQFLACHVAVTKSKRTRVSKYTHTRGVGAGGLVGSGAYVPILGQQN
ncbi:serine/arginine repetitive matrix protein 1-like [Culex quinquefasciatus]|uniref:serine/arginine repetitive matrix protein 1-like n=1 Tax=Culex quinquefasciatus TaxID=7176 RepID=UPI0018E2A117|nr:serine/arginine repetitive matrix protein 1-like [Culex quinquefasciatus]